MADLFVPGTVSDLEAVYALIDARISWMDDVGIQQWNVTNYWECYPKAYYETAAAEGRLYVLKCEGIVVGAVVLREQDKRWNDHRSAFYIHNLVTAIGTKGAGEAILKACFDLAAARKKSRLRLDCSISNKKLNAYYEKQGFTFAGTCADGAYQGNLREKVVLTD